MSLFNRRYMLSLMVLGPVAACGFSPVYGPGGRGSALRDRILFQAPDTEIGYLLVRNLEERLGRAGAAEFTLVARPAISEEGQGITAEGDITRFSVVGRVDYDLKSVATGAVLSSGSVENFTGYSATGTTVETLAAQNDARERLMMILAEQIVTRLLSDVDESA